MRAKRLGTAPLIAAWNSVPKPYMDQGSHPDVVERVWDIIGSSLLEDCRCLVYSTPALVHPKTGIILAFCNGTTYCLRLTGDLMEKALQSGAKTVQKWSSRRNMDAQHDLGSDWVFGCWLEDEIEWCQMVYKEMGIV
jgi:hypothetical protein